MTSMGFVEVLGNLQQQVDIFEELFHQLKTQVGAEDVGLQQVLLLSDGRINLPVDERDEYLLTRLLAILHECVLHRLRKQADHMRAFGGVGHKGITEGVIHDLIVPCFPLPAR